jgi:hypothetical protein
MFRQPGSRSCSTVNVNIKLLKINTFSGEGSLEYKNVATLLIFVSKA